MNLNEKQIEAINHIFGPCYVSACPGSGKTTVLIYRTCALIENENIDPKNILCITFTNKAAQEMKDRLHKMIGDKSSDLFVSTFHYFCNRILHKFGDSIGYDTNTLTIVDASDQEAIMRQSARSLNYQLNTADIRTICYKSSFLREKLLDPYSTQFQQELEPITTKDKVTLTREDIQAIIVDYLERLKDTNQLDFSGLLVETIRLFRTNKDALSRLQNRFQFIQVDETQDSNVAQFEILKHLAQHQNILILGDADQSIYTFRGARLENIQDFINNFKSSIIRLGKNYRSTPEIVKAADNMIRLNPNRVEDATFESVQSSGDVVKFRACENPDKEASDICDQIEDLLNEENYQPKDIAILYRNNYMSRSFEQEMIRRKIDYKIVGSQSFFDRVEIKDVLAMLRFCANQNDSLALTRFINKPSRGIGEAIIGKIEKYAKDNNLTLLQSMANAQKYQPNKYKQIVELSDKIQKVIDKKDITIGQRIKLMISALEYDRYINIYYSNNAANRLKNIDEMASSTSSSSQKDIVSYLNFISLQSRNDEQNAENTVSLMTIHASKGLEFPVVFIPYMNDGFLPSGRSDIQEERRLAYVAMTRAQQKLYLTFNRKKPRLYGNAQEFQKLKPSVFLLESKIMNEQEYNSFTRSFKGKSKKYVKTDRV